MNRSWIIITSRPSLHRTCIPHQSCGGIHRHQALPRSARRLPTSQHPPNGHPHPHSPHSPNFPHHQHAIHAHQIQIQIQVQIQIQAPSIPINAHSGPRSRSGTRSSTPTQNAPPTRTLPTRPRPNNSGALHAAQRALRRARERAGDADADAGA
jgi:hypothetical protein